MTMNLNLVMRDDGTLAVRGAGASFRASGAADATPMYMEGGLFGVSGMHPQVIAAVVNPVGIQSWFQWVPVTEDSPIYDALVYIGTTTTAQSSPCAECGKPEFRECSQTAVLGRYCQQTEEFQIDEIGRKMNRGVPEIALFGSITDPAGNVLIAQGEPISDRFVLNTKAVGYNLAMDVGQELWVGDGTVAGAGGRKRMIGMQTIVNTGKQDALTQEDCEMLDSYLDDYESNVIGADGSPSILAALRAMVRSINYRIMGMNISPDTADQAFVMSMRAWEQVAEAAACEYGLVCADNSAPTRQDAVATRQRAEEWMNQRYLILDGKRYSIMIDNLKPYTHSAVGNNERFCEDIYFLTKSIGGKTVFWGEYQDFNQTAGNTISWLRRQFGAADFAITDGGKFLHAPTVHGGYCFDVRTIVKPRLICTMPQLQGRLQNVCYYPEGSYPDPTGSGGDYELSGGVTDARGKPYLGLYDEAYDSRNPAQ
jgi:hypothetical protein